MYSSGNKYNRLEILRDKVTIFALFFRPFCDGKQMNQIFIKSSRNDLIRVVYFGMNILFNAF